MKTIDTELPTYPFTSTMAKERGISRAVLRRLVRERLVRRLLHDVYLAADVEETVEIRIEAAALAGKPHLIFCDRTAAWIHGIDAYSYGELDLPPIEMCARRREPRCTRAEVDAHSRDLADDDIMTIGGIRVTTPLRTALDLGCLLERKDALAALDAFRRRHGLTVKQLVVAAGRFKGRRGVVQLRELIPLSDPRAESARESWTRLAIIDAGLPVPKPQVWIVVDGVKRYRLDLAYPRKRIVIEYDGWDAHERTPEQKENDRERRDWLRRHGWTVIVVRNGDFTGAALDRWIGELREALRTSYSNRRRLERGSRIPR